VALVEFRALIDEVRPVALSTHEFAVSLAKREGFDIYDALILAAAIEAGCDQLMARDKLNLDIFWLKDDALDDPDLLPPPDEVAAEVIESLEAALASFRSVAAKLQGA